MHVANFFFGPLMCNLFIHSLHLTGFIEEEVLWSWCKTEVLKILFFAINTQGVQRHEWNSVCIYKGSKMCFCSHYYPIILFYYT